VVVADTTALMTAVYSEQLFADTSLYEGALAAQRRYAITLLTALDLPWVADDMRDGPHARQPTDTLLRAALAGAGLSYTVVHGSGGERSGQRVERHQLHRRQRRPRARARAGSKPSPPRGHGLARSVPTRNANISFSAT
jgi:nicotinamide riboside kinase